LIGKRLIGCQSVVLCKFAKALGYGGIVVANTFAYWRTDQKRLLEMDDDIGGENQNTFWKWRRKLS